MRTSKFHYIGFYITGLIDHCLLPAIPASVFFLTFDRCLIVALKSSWTDKRRTILAAVNIAVMVILAIPNLVLPLLYRYYSVPPGCVAFACLQLNASRVTYTATKILTIVLNVIVGIAFLVLVYIFYRSHEGFSKHTSFSGKMGEQMILRILIFEALFDLIPHIVDMTWISVTGFTPFVNFGPYSRVIVSVDNILTSVTNLYAFYVMYKKTRIVGMTASEIMTNIISGKDNGANVVIVGGPGTSQHTNHCHYPVKK
uniref:G_PROTEIN_RECEP_F1_2 domain-containing protein n=1 Tax=Panagrellus redivivus TaxID=6233 RepID=A0A7E4V1K0_PANRE